MATVAVLGCGRWGRNLARTFFDLSALGAVADPDARAREEAARVAPGVRVFESAGEVFGDRAIDAVAIAAPAAQHASLALAALRAGKDVYCEKPFTLSLADAHAVAGAAREGGRIVAVGHLLEYDPLQARLRGIAASGDLGELRWLDARRSGLGRVRRDENVLWSFSPHDVALALRLFGALPAGVSATGAAFVRSGIADVVSAHLRFESGAVAHLSASWLSPLRERRTLVIGSLRSAALDEITGELRLFDARIELRGDAAAAVDGASRPIEAPREEPLRLACEDFLRAIADRRPPRADLDSAVATIRVLAAAQRSMEQGGAEEQP